MILLRDYFAAKAMKSYLQLFMQTKTKPEDINNAFVVSAAYNMADAMLEQRKLLQPKMSIEKQDQPAVDNKIDWNKPLRTKKYNARIDKIRSAIIELSNGMILEYDVNGETTGADSGWDLENYEPEPELISPCCKVECKTNTSEEGTCFNYCSKCEQACDPVSQEQIKGKNHIQETKLRPFDYEAFKAGEKIYDETYTETGEFLREINCDNDNDENIAILWTDEDGNQYIYVETMESCKKHYTMAPKKIKRYVLVMRSESGSYYTSTTLFTDEKYFNESCLKNASNLVALIPIEFEI